MLRSTILAPLFLTLCTLVSPLLATPCNAAEPIRVLLLDYHEPIEHDALLSYLCVKPCTSANGCPAGLVKDGVDYWSDDFTVYRPQYLGQSARFVVQAYKNKNIDFLSISGHHASGFSGTLGRGSFDTEKLANQLRNLPARESFFSAPSMVMLQGCWTDVKSGFDGDPMEYVRHIIEDTAVRRGESERFLAAIQQIAGKGDAYRALFPNACIMGYDGTQVPGGLLEIYGQVDAFMRGMERRVTGDESPAKFSYRDARSDKTKLQETLRAVDRECGARGWPCNLCSQDSDYYSPKVRALASALRAERSRRDHGIARNAIAVRSVEGSLENASLYGNVSWGCSDLATDTVPVFPEPIDRTPLLEMFVDLLMVDLGNIDGAVRKRIHSELVHLLGAVEAEPDARARLLARQLSDEGTAWRRHFVAETLSGLSSFRQRNFYDFLSTIGCTPCFEEALSDDQPRHMRENAASQLRPRLGRETYLNALDDPSARVRLLAASRLTPTLGDDLFALANKDEDPRVQEAAAKARRAPVASPE